MAVPPPEISLTPAEAKPALRTALRARRRAFVEAGRPAAPAFPDSLRARIGPGTVVTFYLPDRFEADPRPIAGQAAALGAQLGLPRITARGEPMTFQAWRAGDPLEDGPLGIRQPAAAAAALTPDIILAPLIGFDATLNRLGQGGGFYDGAFARYPDARRIGIAWSIQRIDTVPVEAWDVALHAVITEQGVFGAP